MTSVYDYQYTTCTFTEDICNEDYQLQPCFSTFLLQWNPEQEWRSLTEPHALIRESSDVREVEATDSFP